jgi:hypothetical protein
MRTHIPAAALAAIVLATGGCSSAGPDLSASPRAYRYTAPAAVTAPTAKPAAREPTAVPTIRAEPIHLSRRPRLSLEAAHLVGGPVLLPESVFAAAAPAEPTKPAPAAPGAPAMPVVPDDPATELRLPLSASRGPLPSFTNTIRRDAKNAPWEFLDATGSVFLQPVPLIILVGAGGGAIATYNTVDDNVRRYYGENNSEYPHTPPRGLRDFADVIGSPEYHIAVAAGLYFLSIPAQDEKFYDFSKTLVYVIGLNAATVGVLKGLVNDPSPNGKAFGFPSGHTSSTIAIASVVHQYYGILPASPVYAAGVLTGWGRLWDREHRFTDVWYGAVIGLVIGHTVAHRRLGKFEGFDVMGYVEPSPNERGGAVGWLSFSKGF